MRTECGRRAIPASGRARDHPPEQQRILRPGRLGDASLPTRQDGLPPTAWPVADDVLLTLLASGRQFRLNLCDGHLEEPDNIQARATPWSGLDPPKPEAQAEIARRMIRPQSPFAILMTRVMSISRSMLVPSDLAFDPKSVRGIARPILGLS